MRNKIESFRSASPKYSLTKYKVSMICEFYREMCVSAIDEAEAKQLAEDRVRARQRHMSNSGYFLGDIELLGVEINE